MPPLHLACRGRCEVDLIVHFRSVSPGHNAGGSAALNRPTRDKRGYRAWCNFLAGVRPPRPRISLPVLACISILPRMFIVSEVDAAAIRAAYEQEGELAAAIEPRRLLPGVTGNAKARECVRTIAGWTPLPSRPCTVAVRSPITATKPLETSFAVEMNRPRPGRNALLRSEKFWTRCSTTWC